MPSAAIYDTFKNLDKDSKERRLFVSTDNNQAALTTQGAICPHPHGPTEQAVSGPGGSRVQVPDQLSLSNNVVEDRDCCLSGHWCSGAILKYLDDDAKRQKLLPAKGSLGTFEHQSVHPRTDADADAAALKEYIYAGSRMLQVVDANAAETPPADLASGGLRAVSGMCTTS